MGCEGASREGWARRSWLRCLALGVLAGVTVFAGVEGPAQATGARGARRPPVRSFRSDPGLDAPAVSASSDPDTTSGDIFLTPGVNSELGGGLMILGSQGRLIWYDPVEHYTHDLQVQSYLGHSVLTWWQGGPQEDVIANHAYQTVAVVKAADGATADMHDFVISPQGTAWLVAFKNIPADLSSVGGPSNGLLHDCLIQELDIKTGQLLWQWDCYGHIPLNASYLPVPTNGTAWDAFHLNSLELLPDGNLLISVRHTWSVYQISTKTGQILWTLGGKYNQFSMGPGTRFEWQHDAHETGQTLTLFDDGAGPIGSDESQSSAKELTVDVKSKTVTLADRYTHTPPLLAAAMGSMQVLPDGNVFVGWGAEPDFSEYTPGGKQIFNGSFALGTSSYRAYRFPWTGQPLTPPDMALAEAPDHGTYVWASWNGATDVAWWRVLGGASPTALRVLATVPDHSFQTRVKLASEPAYVEVRALSPRGQVLPHGTSAVRAAG